MHNYYQLIPGVTEPYFFASAIGSDMSPRDRHLSHISALEKLRAEIDVRISDYNEILAERDAEDWS